MQQGTPKGYLYIPHKDANHLKYLPWCLQGGAGIAAVHTSIREEQPYKPVCVVLNTECNNLSFAS